MALIESLVLKKRTMESQIVHCHAQPIVNTKKDRRGIRNWIAH